MLYGQHKKQGDYGVCVCFAMALAICHSAQFYYEPPIFINVDYLASHFESTLMYAFEGQTLEEFLKRWNKLDWKHRCIRADHGLLYVLKITDQDLHTFNELWHHQMVFQNLPMVVCCVRSDGSDEPDHAVVAVEASVDASGRKVVYAANSQSVKIGRSCVDAHRYTITDFDFNGTEATECKILSADFSEIDHAFCDECQLEEEPRKNRLVRTSNKKKACREKNFGNPIQHHPMIKDLFTMHKYDFYVNKAQGMYMVSEEDEAITTPPKGTTAQRSKKQASGKAKEYSKQSGDAPAPHTPRRGIKWEDPGVSPKKRPRQDDIDFAVIEVPDQTSRYAGLIGEQFRQLQIQAHQKGKDIRKKCDKPGCTLYMAGKAESTKSQATLHCACGNSKSGVRYGGWYWA